MGKRQQLSLLCLWRVNMGVATKRSLQRLLGLRVHPLRHRRLLMSVPHRSYRWLDAQPEGQLLKIPADVADELRICSLCFAVAHAHTRWPVSRDLSATDAMPTMGGGTRARVPRSVAEA